MRLPSSHPPRHAFDFLLLGVAFDCFDGAKVRKDRVLLVEPAALAAEPDPVAEPDLVEPAAMVVELDPVVPARGACSWRCCS